MKPIIKPGDRVRLTPERIKQFGNEDKFKYIDKVYVVDEQPYISPNRWLKGFVDDNQAHGQEHLILVKKPIIVIREE